MGFLDIFERKSKRDSSRNIEERYETKIFTKLIQSHK